MAPVQLDGLVTIEATDFESTVWQLVQKLADGHRREDVDAYLAIFDPAAVWITSPGECDAAPPLSAHTSDKSSPGCSGDGSVTYHVESVHAVTLQSAVAVVEQTYVDVDGGRRHAAARHAHTHIVAVRGGEWLIVAGQNTVRR